jgi:hypothetical protein
MRVGQRRVRVRQSQLDTFLAAGPSVPQTPAADPWRAVAEAATAVTAAVREQNRAALGRAIATLVEAAQRVPSVAECRLPARGAPDPGRCVGRRGAPGASPAGSSCDLAWFSFRIDATSATVMKSSGVGSVGVVAPHR